MLSLESEVLQRHLNFIQDKSVLVAGAVNDDFAQQLSAYTPSVRLWSCYFDDKQVAQSAVSFSAVFTQDLSAQPADLILYYWSKNKQEVQFQLMQLLAQSPQGQQILIVGNNRSGVRSAEKMLAPYGEIAKIDSARRCSLYHFCLTQQVSVDIADYWHIYQHHKLTPLKIYSLPGVFSRQALDQGTELLLSTLTQPIQGKVLDLGCGAGVIGSYIQYHNPKVDLLMTDIHAMALSSAQRTLAENHLQGQVQASNVFSHIEDKFNLIISNPPFHDGIDTDYTAVENLIRQAKQFLFTGGELRLVANSFLPYPDLLDQYFGQHKVLAKTGKFKVYSVIKH
ncbi:16S rRNA (guanine(1207)-N(2))-methyltransferase RsmC [Volucribacter amazonae]|uniref:Ribosomal RNA small subunit methyltransferase C n=1 Tax=Volucribacter amazonae TaxID=256731 RepID=A0A9X4PD22_9PAST|nr:16S rRNA (guanine(1207)-N(2))-methyltransferase RsmC [Volucribacter amazonae]MDG6895937.1 16S rRNA methyltransferase [Volucribacter amazonae]